MSSSSSQILLVETSIYLVLVDCVTYSSLEVCVALKNTLTEFGNMLSSNIEYH